jgi:hypothetical protein
MQAKSFKKLKVLEKLLTAILAAYDSKAAVLSGFRNRVPGTHNFGHSS